MKDRWTDLKIKKPYAVFQCSKLMNVIDRADKYISFYSFLRKTVKCLNVSAKQHTWVHFCVQNTNKNEHTRTSYMRCEGPGFQKSGIQLNPVLMNWNGQRSNQHQEGPNRNPPPPQADSTGVSANTKWTKLLLMGRASNMLQDSVKCALQIRREVNLDRFVNSVLFLFMGGGLVLRNSTLLDPVYAVSSMLGSGVSCIQANCNWE
jgi:hypothetical protein